MSWLFRVVAVQFITITLILWAAPAFAVVAALRTPAQRAVAADVVVVGKVTAIEKELIEAPPFPGAPNKVGHKVAVVKIETNLTGAPNLTHVKIAFVPAAPPAPPPQRGVGRPIRRPLPALELKEGQEMLFFLTKHPSGDFHVMPVMSPPLEIKSEAGKKELETVKRLTETLADPMKGLRSEHRAVRAETAAIVVMKYRSYPEFARDVEQTAIDAEESKLILQALSEGEWSARAAPGAAGMPNAYMAFLNLGLTERDGWTQPVVPQVRPGQPPSDFAAIQKQAFVNWLAGPGKDYVVKKIVTKK
jgi:hypothetical protein